jgi:hypothetical protein
VPTSARYWRVNITSFANNPSIGELEFAPMGGTKFTGTPIESSHWDSSLVPANAFDGDLSTAWSAASNTLPQWLGLDLGSAQQVDVVRIAARNNGQAVTGFDVQSSSDNSTWTTEWSVTGVPNVNRLNSYPRPGQGKVLWKIAVTAVDSGAVWSMSEIELRASAGGSDETAPGGHIFGAFSGGLGWANAIDDDTATIFEASNTAGECYVEFDAARSIAQVAMRSRTDSHADQSAKDFTVQSSPDNQTWTTEFTVTGSTGWTTNELRTFPTAPAYAGPTFRVLGFIG